MPPSKESSHQQPSPQQRVALVTGASRGIGLGCAQALSDAGYNIAIHYRSDPERALAAQKTMPYSQTFRADLARTDACETLIKEITSTMGPISVLVNNAGISRDNILAMASHQDLEASFATNVYAGFSLTRKVIRPMMKQKWGRLIHITSVIGHLGNRGQSVYAATKAAITAFNQSIAAELGRFNILTNCVAPGFIDTDMMSGLTPEAQAQLLQSVHLRRPGTPQNVGDVVAFLASHKADYITGTTIHVNGGISGC